MAPVAYPDDRRRFRRRLTVMLLGAFVFFALLMARMVWLQVVQHEDLAGKAEQNRVLREAPVQTPEGAQ